MESALPLLLGAGFGWLLQKGGLSRYDRIVNVFRLRDFTVIQFLLSALVTGAIGIRLLEELGLASPLPIPSTYLAGNLLGGVVFGVGMALSGFCPGTVAAGAGEGRLDYWIPGGLGLMAGAVIYGLAYDRVMPSIARFARLGSVALPEQLNAEPWLIILLLGEVTLVVFYAIEKRKSGA